MSNEGGRYARRNQSNNGRDAVLLHNSLLGLQRLSCELLVCGAQVMKRSVIGADFEKKDAVPPYSESKQKMKLKRRVSLRTTSSRLCVSLRA